MEIILTIGVKNYALTLVQKKKITKYEFDDIKKSKIEEIFKKHKNASISIILDNIAQNYQKKKFIAPSSVKIEDLVEQELKIQYDNNSFKGAINLGESSDRLNHSEYLLVDIKREEIVDNALKFLSGLPNKIKKICALSLEAIGLINSFSSSDNDTNWEILVSSEGLNILEFLVYNNKKFIKRNIIDNLDLYSEAFIAGKIESEVEKLLEDSDYKPGETKKLYIISKLDLKQYIPDAITITPQHMNDILQIECSNSSFESLISYIVVNSKSYYKLYSPDISSLITHQKINKYVNYIAILWLVSGLSIIIALLLYLSNIRDEIQVITNKSHSLEALQKEKFLQDDLAQFEIKNFKHQSTPMVLFNKLLKLKNPHISIQNLIYSSSPLDNLIQLEIMLDFYNSENKNLLHDIKDFINQVKQEFNNYNISYSNQLQNHISDMTYKVPIKLIIVGPDASIRRD